MLLNVDQIDETFTNVFVYGSYVYDLLHIRDPTNFTYLLIASCQTLHNQVDQLKTENTTLLNRLTTLENLVQQLITK